jgi:ABC-2 type transport system permease protein
VALTFRPATWPWLLAHETRLLWRMTGGAGLAFLLVFGGLLEIGAHVAGWAVMRHFELEAMLRKTSGGLVWISAFVLLLTLSAAFGLVVNVLFTRGDMDLLLASPVPMRNVYAVRGISVALASVAMLALFLLPFANMGAVLGHWGALAAYPVLLAVGLFCAAIAFAGTLALARLMGARRARVTAQLVGAVAGAFLVIAMQFANLLPKSLQAAVAAWMTSDAGRAWFGPHSVLTWPVRALFGDPLPAIAILALGVGTFALVVRLTERAFAEAARDDMTAVASRRRGVARRHRFRAGLARIVIAKELLLIARDPTLIAKTLVQILYLVPMMVILLRQAELSNAIGASLVLMASSIAGTFAWITISGEEAPDLLDASPVSAERVRWLKMAAALVPSCVVVLPFFAWYATRSLRELAIVVVFTAMGLASASIIQVWTGKPGQARDLRTKQQKQNVGMNFMEMFCSLGWGLACFLALAGYYKWVAIGVLIGLGGPAGARLLARWRDG